MPTATVHLAEVDGYAGRARCFAIDPPYQGHGYVTVCVEPAFGDVILPEAKVYPATETGACAERSLKRRPGSVVLHDEATTDDGFTYACWLVLLMLGQPGYELQAAP
ncbi:hypothetical protein [Nocardia wallacei]|uniref:hypothetical protein n=1 Tax=Nocardia wallacei TaxID=480035 RepID=UPI002456534B|nr:hypothetical protein [Nocardia wallacei]